MRLLIGAGILLVCLLVAWMVLRRPLRQIVEDVHVDHARAVISPAARVAGSPVHLGPQSWPTRSKAKSGMRPTGTTKFSGHATGNRDTCSHWSAFISSQVPSTSRKKNDTPQRYSSFARDIGLSTASASMRCVPTRLSAATNDSRRSSITQPNPRRVG